MSENIVIPPRSLSQRKREPTMEETVDLEREQDVLNSSIKSIWKRLKSSGSFDLDLCRQVWDYLLNSSRLRYWRGREETASMTVRRVDLQRKISIQNLRLKNTEDKWENTEKGRKIREQTEIFSLEERLIRKRLQKAWNYKEKKEKVVTDQLGKKFWGTPRPYMRRTMLQAFITEVGHEFEEILVGAETGKEGGQELDYTALAAAAQ
ncbi:MAG: hypothetical protein Q9187_006015 [Circinaria calcarea]